jgi:hypothetical protein
MHIVRQDAEDRVQCNVEDSTRGLFCGQFPVSFQEFCSRYPVRIIINMTSTILGIVGGKDGQKKEIINAEALDTSIQRVILDLYPTLTNEELKQAGENLQKYFEATGDFERGLDLRPASDLDSQNRRPTIKERSKVEKN